ncbi:MAG: ATP-dependent helicase [Lachnospiraceae bacterium]|nr:ATP-dependent helicase [Lachnospiraceae bacterium]
MKFNESQLTAISHRNGPALVLAGPGSGKTAVVTHRVKALITEQNVNPGNILVITFTKAAAKEMKERFLKLMQGSGQGVMFGTFHGVFFTILRHAYHYNAENIIREEEQLNILRRIISRLGMEYDNEKDFLTNILAEISSCKGEGMNLSNYYATNCASEAFRSIYREYDLALRRMRKIDFDDMILYTYELLKERKDLRKAWQEKFRYILIDEFQDINHMQYEVVKLLLGKEENLFVVGDDDQSIYSFRGARPEIMLNYRKDFPKARVISLTVNYRCPQRVVKEAGALIAHNEKRYAKKITAHRTEDAPVIWRRFTDVHEEAMDFIEHVRLHHKEGGSYNDFALLTRTNDGARYYLEKMMEYNIPFRAKDTIPSIYNHWIAKNIMAYINLALGNRDRNVFLQIMNKPKRYIGRDVLMSPLVDFDEIREAYRNDRAWMLERIDRFEDDLTILSRLNPYAGINYIRRGIGYDEYLEEYAREMNLNPEELFLVLNELQESAREFNDYRQWFQHIEAYEETIQKKNAKGGEVLEEAVNVVTMHGAKGLEFPLVYILDANEDVIPYRKAILNDEVEEERRMFYVAMTRTTKELHISCVRTRFNKAMEPSRFIEEARGTAL